jgi:hypothetical protein
MSQESTIGEVNKAVGELSEKVDSVLEAIGEFSSKNDERLNRIESDIVSIKSQMVTKDYLDDKLINLKADLTVLVHKEDNKLGVLAKGLASKKVITDADAKSILSMEPFPQKV